mgnify:CR=1 FL=1
MKERLLNILERDAALSINELAIRLNCSEEADNKEKKETDKTGYASAEKSYEKTKSNDRDGENNSERSYELLCSSSIGSDGSLVQNGVEDGTKHSVYLTFCC